MTQIRVNIRHRVQNAAIRNEKRNGRDVIIVPSATLPDDVIMNGIKYPADVIEAGYKTLERTPAPLGHPRINGAYINANDPESINGFWVGAWNESVRRENGRVLLDKVIDVERAQSTEGGKALLEAINKGDPIHTSTGLFLDVEPVDAEDHDRIAVNMVGDHDAFLLNEEGAATPEQGVGVFVNSNGEQLEVVNSEMEDDELEGALSYAFEVLERKDKRAKRNGLTSQVVAFMQKLLNSGSDEPTDEGQSGLNVNRNEEVSMTPEELQAALDKQAETLQANFDARLAEAVKPLHDQLEANKAEKDAAEKAEHAKAVEAVVNAKLMDKEEAEQVPTLALNAMIKASKRAAPLAGGFAANGTKDTWADYDLNANMEDK